MQDSFCVLRRLQQQLTICRGRATVTIPATVSANYGVKISCASKAGFLDSQAITALIIIKPGSLHGIATGIILTIAFANHGGKPVLLHKSVARAFCIIIETIEPVSAGRRVKSGKNP